MLTLTYIFPCPCIQEFSVNIENQLSGIDENHEIEVDSTNEAQEITSEDQALLKNLTTVS